MDELDFDLKLIYVNPEGETVSREGPFRVKMPLAPHLRSSAAVHIEGECVFEGTRQPVAFDVPLQTGGRRPSVTLRQELWATGPPKPAGSRMKVVEFSDGRSATVRNQDRGQPELMVPRNVEVLVGGQRQAWTDR